MTAPYQKVLTDGQSKLLKRYMVVAATVYAFIMIGVLTAIFTSDASDDNASGYGVASQLPAFQPGRVSQMLDSSQTTDGHNKTMERKAPEAAMRALPPARVPVPEVDELGEAPPWPGDEESSLAAKARSAAREQGETLAENAWDFGKPETIPGFGAIVEHGTTPDGQRLTARQGPVSNR